MREHQHWRQHDVPITLCVTIPDVIRVKKKWYTVSLGHWEPRPTAPKTHSNLTMIEKAKQRKRCVIVKEVNDYMRLNICLFSYVLDL